MNQETDMLVELWAGIKPFINAKDRLDVADHLVAVFDDFGMGDGLEGASTTVDNHLEAAIKGRYGIDSADEEEDEYADQY